ncbi:energy-coupling factor ABC transporter substrate-binding protein [Oleispirillum naphthae]|uniref:energy-coupling factor ABC transporter substrate-binding protein n=1 Tax=Oleispirillum naphthae TaxID=2838853 RepID=UPI0030822AD1
MNLLRNNTFLIALVALIVVVPLALPIAESMDEPFGGSDDKAEGVIAEVAPDYKPWFSSIWEPPSGEIESLLFALQASLGTGILAYYIGLRRGMARGAKKD